jgi:hypothetical protein
VRGRDSQLGVSFRGTSTVLPPLLTLLCPLRSRPQSGLKGKVSSREMPVRHGQAGRPGAAAGDTRLSGLREGGGTLQPLPV